MHTSHKILCEDARKAACYGDTPIDMVITSPPYPIIAMWDETFSRMHPPIRDALTANQGAAAFELMHQELDKVWAMLAQIIRPGGIVCINIGDAVRTFAGNFQLYPNAARITAAFRKNQFDSLPRIIWRKQTNAPNKFMGSGMLPCGAYVTLEHEYILIFRKGGKRTFQTADEKANRYASAFFWEERNKWFSDVWFDLKGASQSLTGKTGRERSGAFPFELAYRLINMYSIKGDTVLDPFLGSGTSTLAAIAAARNSLGLEIDHSFQELIFNRIRQDYPGLNQRLYQRLAEHRQFAAEYEKKKKKLIHYNRNHDFPVVTGQEKEIQFDFIEDLQISDNTIMVRYTTKEEKSTDNPELFPPA